MESEDALNDLGDNTMYNMYVFYASLKRNVDGPNKQTDYKIGFYDSLGDLCEVLSIDKHYIFTFWCDGSSGWLHKELVYDFKFIPDIRVWKAKHL